MQVEIEPLFHLAIYSHFFKVIRPHPRIVGLCWKFCSNYVQYGWVKERGSRYPVKKPVRVFAGRTKCNSEFRFHRGQLKPFMALLEREFITPDLYTVEEIPLHKPAYIDIELRSGKESRDYQIEAKNFVLEESPDDNNSRLIAMPTGTGKAQPLDAKIKVPGGWKLMGQICVGDVITAKDGSRTIVTGTYPQGMKPIFKVTFADGRYTECTLDHLWKIHETTKHKPCNVMTTRQLMARMKFSTLAKRCYIDLSEPEDSPDIDLPLDPYLLGILLGDGTFRGNRVGISTPDEEIVKYVKSNIPDHLALRYSSKYDYHITKRRNGKVKNDLINTIKNLGLFDKYSHEKHIPDIYFHGSIKQRLSLLQGLLDTDGTVCIDGGSVQFSSSSKELSHGVQYLVRSLGGIASIYNRIPTFTYKGEKKNGRMEHRVNIRYKKPSQLFRLTKKKVRTIDDNQYSATLKLRVEKIEFSGHKEAQCISISHPEKLYVTDDFIVTHNTFVSLSVVDVLKNRVVIAVLAKYLDKWCNDVRDGMIILPKEIMLVQGSEQLQGLIELAKNGELTSKVIIISLTTLRNFYKTYEENPLSSDVEEYGCMPEDLFPILRAGTVIIDEAHEHIYAVFKLMLYMHVHKVIALTATLISEDPFIDKIHHLMFPREIRFNKVKMDKYIRVYAVAYQFNDMAKARIRTTEVGSNTYSHTAFEKSILRNIKVKENYLKLINSLVRMGFIDNYRPGDKLAVYAGSIDMCTLITNYLKDLYPQFDVRRYVEDDPFENAMEADIRVTTILSGGTALDIPNLRVVIQTINIQSPVANLQVLGRLRDLKDPSHPVKFYYVYCDQIKKHVEYHRARKELFQERVASIKEFRANVVV